MEDWRVVVRQDHGQKTASNEPNAVIQTTTNPTSTAGGPGGQLPPSTTSSQAASVPSISTNYVTFNENSIFTADNTFGGSDRIFVSDYIKTHAVDFTYSWEDSSFEPLNVSLIVVNQNNNNVDRTNVSSSSSSSLSLTNGSIKFNYTKLTEGAEEGQSGVQASVDGFILALDMYWQSKGKSLIGHSYSPYFSILGNTESFKASNLQSTITTTYGTNGDGRDADVTTLASPSSSSSNTASDGHSNPSSGGGGGGLSTGAIVGIAIGGAAGLAIIALVAWFLLRRRKSKSQIVDTHGASNAYIADKDSTAQSPQSPYADDVIHNPRADSSSLHNAHADNVPGPRDGSGTATPSGLSRNVAHLVEEGMTADDIARLEEEERQLDDEIERAASQAARR
ncbi:unnamed protein product [Clonostachys chloroleuca]|uniref:Mid2 domain-containing protein n=1 Tax=Clonostachys chloroleuca TaxID=1926264 RepID=A0AA35MES4_9HYPO|nr:unnamed protein product [Clonostachys chloroleuca]